MSYQNAAGRIECPACSSKRTKREPGCDALRTVHTCLSCGALFGEFGYLADSYRYVGPSWCGCPGRASESGMIESRYFDFTGLTAKGSDRRHGWYHPACGRLTQAG